MSWGGRRRRRVAERDAVDAELESLRPTCEGARAEEEARTRTWWLRGPPPPSTISAGGRGRSVGPLQQVVTSARAEAQRLRERRDAVSWRPAGPSR
ncbi:hypothetical protein HBB16_08855 [Pseudonocardia sp. MCCB 268]|nr:hypothetical protein [Pseudonocardia cytotoxica]